MEPIKLKREQIMDMLTWWVLQKQVPTVLGYSDHNSMIEDEGGGWKYFKTIQETTEIRTMHNQAP